LTERRAAGELRSTCHVKDQPQCNIRVSETRSCALPLCPVCPSTKGRARYGDGLRRMGSQIRRLKVAVERCKWPAMAVPFNDTRRRFADSRQILLDDWGRLLDQGVFIGGPAVASFEQAFASYCNTAHCVGLGNGTDALEIMLRAVGISGGDEVIVVANAGGYATSACLSIGAIPVYVDVNIENCQIDPDAIDEAVGPSTKAIVVTHLYGLMSDVAEIRKRLLVLGRQDIVLVEDCAQAHGARLNGARAGGLGAAGAFSFYPTKNLGAVGDAGAVVCNNAELATRVQQLRQYGWRNKYDVTIGGGRNSRIDPFQTIVLLHQLPKLDKANAIRRNICRLYAGNLGAGWQLVHADDLSFVGHLAVLIAPDAAARGRACDALKRRGIGHDIHYPILDCDQTGWHGYGRIVGTLPRSRELTERVLSIPCFAELTDEELEQVVDVLRTFK
jgi:dTDP-3-amino-2,3,6-trideoxy-4-keto-D-glucose/dTDP-3-amino-3,4,6-trideoxy-alpha-D-glucose/dTDP-2,6-dideoxy-D-kanosamine transaminase